MALIGKEAKGMTSRALVKATGKQPHELFDVICDTSTGGILAVLLAGSS